MASVGLEIVPVPRAGEVVRQDLRGVRQPGHHPRHHWKPAEDNKLRELVSEHGPYNWDLISGELEGRSGNSCRLRWCNHVDPKINWEPFSSEEEEVLVDAYNRFGNRWSRIGTLLPGRTATALKSQWQLILERKHRAERPLHGAGTPPSQPQPQPQPQRMEIGNGSGSASASSTVNPERSSRLLMGGDRNSLPSSSGLSVQDKAASSSSQRLAVGLPVQHSPVTGLPVKNAALGIPLQNSAVRLGTVVRRCATCGCSGACGASQNQAIGPVGAAPRMRLTFIDFMGVGEK